MTEAKKAAREYSGVTSVTPATASGPMTAPAMTESDISITDATRPDLDFESLANDITVRGEVYRQLKPSLESDDERTREVGLRALRYAFSALEGDRII